MKYRVHCALALIISLSFQLIPSAQAAPIVAFNGLMSGCDTIFSSGNIYGTRFLANRTTTITAINVSVGSSLNSNWSTTKYFITSYNPATNRPGVILETFTATATSGSGASTLVRFTGSYTLAAGTKFYVFPSVSFSTFPACYSNAPPTANNFPNDGVNVDTTTTLSNNFWTKAFIGGSWPGANSSSWSVNDNERQMWQLSLEATNVVPVSVSIAVAGGSRSAIYRQTKSISAAVDVSALVTFYGNGKRIAGCINVLSSAGTAGCTWKPSTRGTIQLKALAKPTSADFTSSWSSTLEILISSRGGSR